MKKRLLYFIALILISGSMYGWDIDVSKNTQITPTGLAFYEDEVKTNEDGISYVFMLGQSMRLQIVDCNGERLLSRSGMVISNEPNSSWFGLNQYLELDRNGDAFVAVEDYRDYPAENLFTYHIYKYNASGTKVMDAVTLNGGTGYKLASGLSMCATDDGGCVCTFVGTDEQTNSDYIIAEKIDSEGKSVWKKSLYTGKALSGVYPFLADLGDNRVMIFIVENGTIRCNILEADGSLAQERYNTVFDGGLASPKIWEVLTMEELPGHKVMFSLVDGTYQGRLLVVNGDGSIGLDGSKAGVLLSESDPYYSSDKPAVAYNETDGTYTCLYKVFDRLYTYEEAMYVKKLNSDGSVVWTEPEEIVAIQEDMQHGYFVMRNIDNGRCAMFYMEMNRSNYNDVKNYMQIIESDGSRPNEAVPFATSLENKQTLRVSEFTNGQFIAAWDAEHNGQMSLFMQNIIPNSSDAIGNITSRDDNTCGRKEYFSPNGMKLSYPCKGLNIIKTGDGKNIKIVK